MAEVTKPGTTPPLTPQDEATKFAKLFDAAYHYNPSRKTLDEKDGKDDGKGKAVEALQTELDRLAQSTFLNAAVQGVPKEAKKRGNFKVAKTALAQWDLPSITRYWYLTDPRLTPTDRGLLWRLALDPNDKNHASPMEAANYMASVEIKEVDGYDGKGIPFFFQPRADGLLYGVQFFTGEAGLAAAAQVNAQRVALDLITQKSFATLDEKTRRRLYHTANDHHELDGRFADLRKRILTSADQEERKKAAQEYDYISFVLAGRPPVQTLKARTLQGCSTGVSSETCDFQAAEEEATKTASPWDNYQLQLELKERLLGLASQAAKLLGRPDFVGTDLSMQDGLLTQLTGWKTDVPTKKKWEWVNGIMQPLAEASGRAPDGRDLLDALRAELEESPLFAGLLDLDDGTGANLQWFLDRGRGNIQEMMLVDNLPRMKKEEIDGTALRIARIAVIKADPLTPLLNDIKDREFFTAVTTDPLFPYLKEIYRVALLVHETSHLQFPREEVFKNPALAQAHLLDERNGYLRESRVLEWGLKHLPHEATGPLKKFFFGVYAETRLKALSANVGLGYPSDDDTIRTDLAVPAWDPRLGLDPNDFKDSWLAVKYPSAKSEERLKQFQTDLKDQLGLAGID